MRNKKSVLFVVPDYHCSFFYREQLIESGWKADIYAPNSYPKNLLYSQESILRSPYIPFNNILIIKYINQLLLVFWWMLKFWRYEFHIYYGEPPAVNVLESKLGLTRLFGKDFVLELWLSKIFGVKLIHLPPGCRNDETKENFSKLDSGNVCNNCGMFDRCDDRQNNLNFSRIRRYFDMAVGIGAVDSTQFKMTHLKWKSIDLDLWNANSTIPKEHQLPKTKNLKILHSSYLAKSGRDWNGRNIKGSPSILSAIERLKREGHCVEYFHIHNKKSKDMRFYQAQADIIVDQLIYGWWGSTVVEATALGKPVVCYLRPSWKQFFLKVFPEYPSVPIIEATTDTIYEVLKNLVVDAQYRRQKGEDARAFAESHFDPKKNTVDLIKTLERL